MKMAKKKYVVPALEIIQLQANIAVMIADSYHDGGVGGGYAPERRPPMF
jgi:hypothetical protein